MGSKLFTPFFLGLIALGCDTDCVLAGAILVKVTDSARVGVDADSVLLSVNGAAPYDCPRRRQGEYHCFSETSGDHEVTVTVMGQAQSQSVQLVSSECGPDDPQQLDFVVGATPDGGIVPDTAAP